MEAHSEGSMGDELKKKREGGGSKKASAIIQVRNDVELNWGWVGGQILGMFGEAFEENC